MKPIVIIRIVVTVLMLTGAAIIPSACDQVTSLAPFKHDVHLIEVDGHSYVIAYPLRSYQGVAITHHAGCTHISHRGDIYRKLCK